MGPGAVDVDDRSADPAAVAAYLESHPREALRRSIAVPSSRSTDENEARLAWVLQIPEGPDRIGMMREALAELDEDARLRLALRFPTQIGDCHNGAALDLCFAANRINITATILVAGDSLLDLQRGPVTADTPATIAGMEATLDVYRGLLAPPDPSEVRMNGSLAHRQIAYFNPTEDCGLIEFNGDPSTADYVALVTTGAATDIKSYPLMNGIARDFMRSQPPGELAIVTYAPGDFPAQPGASLAAVLIDAFRPEYARKTAPRLVTFGNDILRPLMTPDAKLTALGYSYGGVIAGTAAKLGLNADRLLLVLSPGGGLGVYSMTDYQRADGKPMEAFSLSNRTDFVHWCRIFAPHLGGNPQLMEGVVSLPPPRYAEEPRWLDELEPILARLGDLVFEPGGELHRHRISHLFAMTPNTTGPDQIGSVATFQPVLPDKSTGDAIDVILRAEDRVIKAARALFDRTERPRRTVTLEEPHPQPAVKRGRRGSSRGRHT